MADDVGNETYHRSRTDEIVNSQDFELRNHRPRWKLTPHRHYRIVLQTIGRQLKYFNSTREFVQAIYAALKGKMTIFLAFHIPNLTCIIAHQAAYSAGILQTLALATY